MWLTRFLTILLPIFLVVLPQTATKGDPHVAIVDMNMMILPGTSTYLSKAIQSSADDGAKILIVKLNTPGGMLNTSQEMIQAIFKSPIPVVVYVSPTGSTAASAGVFITMAGHVAAMAPGTSIGAAHPVTGEGKDIEGDMRKKAENLTISMVKSITEERGRNKEWAEKAVKESSSATEKEAVKLGVVDFVADDIDDLLRKIKGKEIQLDGRKIVLEDYSKLPKREVEMEFKDRVLNIFANPNVLALLWLAATTGLSIELYNPGAILPGVVGIICLILALAVSQIIPISQSAILLLVVGVLLIGLEMFVPSGILGIGGIIAILLGSLYLVDTGAAPGMEVSFHLIGPTALFVGILLFVIVRLVVKTHKRPSYTGYAGLIGAEGRAVETIAKTGKIFVNGEYWNATVSEGAIEKDAAVIVVGIKDGMILEVRKS